MEYSFREMPDLHGTGKRKMVPEPTFCSQIGYKDFLKECTADGSGFTEAEIDGVVQRIVNRLSFYLDMGHSVKIDGLGTFRLKLAMKPGEEVPSMEELKGKRHPTEKVEVDSIQFRADSLWIAHMKRRCELVYTGRDKSMRKPETTAEERLRMALNYLETHHEMRLIDYVLLTGLPRTTASLELRRFRSDPNSGIRGVGSRNQLRYVRRDANLPPEDALPERIPFES